VQNSVPTEIGTIALAAARNAIARLINENAAMVRSGNRVSLNGPADLRGSTVEGTFPSSGLVPRGCRAVSKEGDDVLIAQLLSQLRLNGSILSGGLNTVYEPGTTSQPLSAGYQMFDVPYGFMNGQY